MCSPGCFSFCFTGRWCRIEHEAGNRTDRGYERDSDRPSPSLSPWGRGEMHRFPAIESIIHNGDGTGRGTASRPLNQSFTRAITREGAPLPGLLFVIQNGDHTGRGTASRPLICHSQWRWHGKGHRFPVSYLSFTRAMAREGAPSASPIARGRLAISNTAGVRCRSFRFSITNNPASNRM